MVGYLPNQFKGKDSRMSRAVFRYDVSEPDLKPQDIKMERGAIIRHFGVNAAGQLSIWAEIDTDQPLVVRRLYVVGTGWQLPMVSLGYLATAVVTPFVWHLFDGGEAIINDSIPRNSESWVAEGFTKVVKPT
jgi:hypothetical protein